MPVIVDTYNVLHVTGVLPPELAGIDVAGLADLIEASRYRAEMVWLVCDGTGRGARSERRERIVTHYTGIRSDADSHIGRMIDGSSTPRRLTVVSSDHRVRRMALRRRCVALSSEAFLGQLASDANRRGKPREVRPPVPLDQQQVDRWVREFGLEGALLDVAPAATSAVDGPRPDVGESSAAPTNTQVGPSMRDPSTTRGSGTPSQSSPPTSPRRRALEGVSRLDEIDPAELERFDMNEWLPPETPRRGNRASRRRPGR